ncbi:MAG: hypothetical protein WC958_03165 [Dehalococcoidales bacterium]
MKAKLYVISFLLVLSVLFSSCQQKSDFDRALGDVIDPYRFSLVSWEIKTLTSEIEDALIGDKNIDINNTDFVINFFDVVKEISSLEFQLSFYKNEFTPEEYDYFQNKLIRFQKERDLQKREAEKIIGLQIRETLKDLDLYFYNDIIGFNIPFPPINFSIETPPHLLIVSPRDNISRMRESILLQDLTADEIEYIEKEVDALGYSSIVLRVGGMATFPAFVSNTSGLKYTLSTVVEEWFHQYFFFKTTGFLYASYLLGLYEDSDISTINETIAGIVSDEIADIVYQKYYARYFQESPQTYASADTFDYYAEMRNIRLTVDDYLANGEVEKAEAYMEERRLYILENGYYIRRLNQAYFAFYGTYAGGSGSVNPIGDMLWDLRNNCDSVTDFIKLTSSIKTLDDLHNISE